MAVHFLKGKYVSTVAVMEVAFDTII